MPAPSGFECPVDGRRDTAPLCCFLSELLETLFGQPVVLRAPIVLGRLPDRGEPSGFFQPVECRKQRSRLDMEGAARDVEDSAGHTKSVQLLRGERFQNEQIESAL